MIRLITSAFAALALAGMAPAAFAKTETTNVSVSVSYADLNLASAAGAETMLGRLKTASRKVCGGAARPGPMGNRWKQACIREAMVDAVSRLNAPVVTAMLMGAGRYEMASH